MENQNMPKEDSYKTEKDIANLWVETLNEHGRDEESVRGIHDFFVTMIGLDTPHLLCHYKVGEQVLYYHGSKGWIHATIVSIGHEKIYQDFEWGKDKDGNTIRILKSPKYNIPTKIEIQLNEIKNDLGEHITIPLTYYHENNKPIEIDLEQTNFVMFPKTEHRLYPDERPYLLYDSHRKYITASSDNWGYSKTSLRLCKIKERGRNDQR
jgi:hypothetical protein